MTDKSKSVMEGVSLESTQVLVELIANYSTVERALIERRFRERARGFDETIKFMEEMQAIEERGPEIRRAGSLNGMQEALRVDERTFIEHIMRLGVDSPTSYGEEIRAVLQAFRLEEGQARLGSEDLSRELYAARNILLEAEAMQLDHEAGTYTINNWFYREFIKARYAHGTTPEKLDDIVKEQAEIGLAAELQVFKHEQKTVGQRDASNVVHISLENTNAGFDIASMRREEETDQIRIRMIEVKAVSPIPWTFTLTRNEVRVATESKDTYFLYLVPIIKGIPAVTKMDIIQNPVRVLLHGDEWTIEHGDWSVSRAVRYD